MRTKCRARSRWLAAEAGGATLTLPRSYSGAHCWHMDDSAFAPRAWLTAFAVRPGRTMWIFVVCLAALGCAPPPSAKNPAEASSAESRDSKPKQAKRKMKCKHTRGVLQRQPSTSPCYRARND